MQNVETIKYDHLEPFYHVPDARLSEGLTYIKESDTLLWVDIFKGEIHRLDDVTTKGTSQHDQFVATKSNYLKDAEIKYPDSDLHESVGCIFPVLGKDGKIDSVLFGGKHGVGHCKFSTKKWEYIALYSSCPELKDHAIDLRSNDGNVGPDGTKLYVGVMPDFHVKMAPIGAYVTVDLMHKPHKVEMFVNHINIPNAIHWDKTNTKIHWTDSLNHAIVKIENGQSSKFINIKNETNAQYPSPEPDGSCIDLTNNTIYICVWSARKIQKYSLTDGRLLTQYLIPEGTPRPSSCCFVGRDLIVTTANEDIEHGKAGDHTGGCLYRIPDILPEGVDVGSAKRQPIVTNL
ncbi:rRNA-processing protein CGR1 [Nakaseomyces bracarensis]|uniref:rRNA-processing protein CGR1 n=1 Tax=Nakaseomyces bracarensis TaxID=273131 RepID=A0ABR4NMB0_9SACH